MVHLDNVDRYPGSLSELAADVGNLRYDALAAFLRQLAGKLEADATADEGRGRRQLAKALKDAATHVAASAADIDRAWRICAPFM